MPGITLPAMLFGAYVLTHVKAFCYLAAAVLFVQLLGSLMRDD